jgi:hypothetical protein
MSLLDHPPARLSSRLVRDDPRVVDAVESPLEA